MTEPLARLLDEASERVPRRDDRGALRTALIPIAAALARVPGRRAARRACARRAGGRSSSAARCATRCSGCPCKDYDVEVFGLAARAPARGAGALGSVNAVGEAFTVFKLRGLPGVDGAGGRRRCRAATPRSGPGHRGIAVVGDPGAVGRGGGAPARLHDQRDALRSRAAARSSIPTAGAPISRRGVLRAVDAATFGEDPLRALRAVQFAARFELDGRSRDGRGCARRCRCASCPPSASSARSRSCCSRRARPSIGLRAAARVGHAAERVAPELLPLADTPQDPEWHPEGDVWIHTLLAVDEAAAARSPTSTARAR